MRVFKGNFLQAGVAYTKANLWRQRFSCWAISYWIPEEATDDADFKPCCYSRQIMLFFHKCCFNSRWCCLLLFKATNTCWFIWKIYLLAADWKANAVCRCCLLMLFYADAVFCWCCFLLMLFADAVVCRCCFLPMLFFLLMLFADAVCRCCFMLMLFADAVCRCCLLMLLYADAVCWFQTMLLSARQIMLFHTNAAFNTRWCCLLLFKTINTYWFIWNIYLLAADYKTNAVFCWCCLLLISIHAIAGAGQIQAVCC